MSDYLIEFTALETYHGNRHEMKRLITAENSEKAWERLQQIVAEEKAKEGYGTYVSFVLKDAQVLVSQNVSCPKSN